MKMPRIRPLQYAQGLALWNSTAALLAPGWNGAGQAASSPAARFLSGTAWATAGSVVSQGLSLVASIAAGRALGRDAFGAYSVIVATASTLGIFAGLGLGLTATKYVSSLRKTDVARTSRVIRTSRVGTLIAALLFSVALWLLAVPVAGSLNAPAMVVEVRLSALLVLFSTINNSQIGILSGFEAFKAIARANVCRGIALLAATIVGVRIAGVAGGIAACVFSYAAAGALMRNDIAREMRRHAVPPAAGAWVEWKMLFQFSSPALLIGSMATPVHYVSSLFLVRGANGLAQMGIFQAANVWRNSVLFLPNMLNQVMLPILSNLTAAGDFRSYRRLFAANFAGVVLVTGLAAAVLAVFAEPLTATYGPAFRGHERVLVLLAIATVFNACSSVGALVIVSLGNMWCGLLLNACWAFILIGLSSRLVRSSGAEGLAAANLGAYAIHLLLVAAYAHTAMRRTSRS
jgi:O-antigen/teichoic acid export membrane protein